MILEVLSREELEESITEVLQSNKIKDGDLFIAGVTKAKAYNGLYKMCMEIVQARILPFHEVNLTTTIFQHDDRYEGEILSDVRVKVIFTVEGFDYLFYSLTNHSDVNRKLTGAELDENTKNLKDNEILGVFARIRMISVEGEIEIPKISIKQYSIKNGLPEKIKKIIDIDEVNRTAMQFEELNSMTLVNKENESMVDEFRNQVYEINTFTYSDDEDVYLKKISISGYYDYILDVKNRLSDKKKSSICKTLSSNKSMLWTSELIEKYEDKWDWNELSKNASIPWTLKLINKYADKLSCSESIWNRLKPYIDEELIEDVFTEINKS